MPTVFVRVGFSARLVCVHHDGTFSAEEASCSTSGGASFASTAEETEYRGEESSAITPSTHEDETAATASSTISIDPEATLTTITTTQQPAAVSRDVKTLNATSHIPEEDHPAHDHRGRNASSRAPRRRQRWPRLIGCVHNRRTVLTFSVSPLLDELSRAPCGARPSDATFFLIVIISSSS